MSVISKRTQQAITDKEKSKRKLGKHGGDRKSEEVKNQGSNQKVDKSYGETTDYLLDRIERDYPETYESVKAGEFKSARAAAISVGLVKKDDRWSAPGPVEKLAALIRKRKTSNIFNCFSIE